jgi:ATP-dependent helicase HrpA
VHQALLAGLLSHLGMRDGTTREYRGAHGSKFMIGQGSVVGRSLPRWVIAAELVETNRLWGRMVAAVQPEWAEPLGAHLVKRSYGEPVWDARRGAAVCREAVGLYGLPIANRTIGYDRVNRAGARELFIRCALVEGDWGVADSLGRRVFERNERFLTELKAMGERLRRVHLVDGDAVHSFYDRRLGPEVVSTRHFDRWWKATRGAQPELLTMRVEDFLGGTGVDSAEQFPTTWQYDGMELALTYRFDPGAADDGVTVHIPLAVLDQITPAGFDWQVPGFRDDLVAALLKSLPKEHRRELSPMAETTARVVTHLAAHDADGSSALAQALSGAVREVVGGRVPAGAFDAAKVPAHLRVTFSIDDEHGTRLAAGKDLDSLRADLAPRVRAAVARSMAIEERKGIVAWDFGDLPAVVESARSGITVRGYPALLDEGPSVSIRVFTNPELQAKVMRNGVRRLLLLAVPVGKRAIEHQLTNDRKLAIARHAAFTLEGLEADCLAAAADRVVDEWAATTEPSALWTEAGFAAVCDRARRELAALAGGMLCLAGDILAAAALASARLERLVAPAVAASAGDARAHLGRLVRPGFVAAAGPDRLADVLRYVQALDHRLTRLPEDPDRDRARLREVTELERRYSTVLDRTPRAAVTPRLAGIGWMLEELRVSVFAQQLGAARGTSAARVAKELAAHGG